MKKLALSSILFAAVAPSLLACDDPARIPASAATAAEFQPGMLEALPGMMDQITAFVSARQTIEVHRDDTSETTLQLVGLVELSPSITLRAELVPDLRADGVHDLIDGWTGARAVEIEWEGTFEYLAAEGDAVRIGAGEVATTIIDEEIRTLCGATQRVRAWTWLTVDGVRFKAMVSLGVQEGHDRVARDAVSDEGISAGGNCQIKWYWWSGYSWCENTAGTEGGGCTFVQQVTQSTSEICLSGTAGGGVISGGGITVGGGGGSGTATGTWGTVTQMIYATFPGACIHVDGWFEDYCECRATGAPSYSVVPMGCSGGGGGTCTTPTTCPSAGTP